MIARPGRLPLDRRAALARPALNPLEFIDLVDERFRAPSFAPLRTLVRATFALPPEPGDEGRLWQHAERKWPTARIRVLVLYTGRRTAKTELGALLGCYYAAVPDWTPYLSRGERATALLASPTRDQSAICTADPELLPAGFDPLDPNAEHAFALAGLDVDLAAIRSITFTIRGDANNFIDELRIGDSYASVVPEPGTGVLLLAGLAGLAVGGRKR